ncbi:hypothetical protein PAMA_012640 [Pampus argenteus]
MVIYYPMIEVSILCIIGMMLWIFFCYFEMKHRGQEGCLPRPNNSPSVYVIPIYEEEREEEEEIMGLYGYFQPPPPPYRLEPPSCPDPSQPYTNPPPYSEHP